MTPDDAALFGIGIGLIALVGTQLARRTGLPDPVVLVAAGLAASLLPGVPEVDLPPDLVFFVFLPPLLFRAAVLTSPRTLRTYAVPLLLLAVGLVLATAVLVGLVVAAVVPGLGFSEGLVLGAIVAPTDPVAAASVFRRLGAPQRVADLVEGESLVNDASALVLYALAVEAVLSGPPSVGAAGARLLVSVAGGVAIGVVVTRLVVLVRRRLDDIGLQLLLSLVAPYAAYIGADRVEASGVLAVVTTGVMLGAQREGAFRASARLQSDAFWSLLDLGLNAVLFVLLGLEVRRVLADTPALGAGSLVASSLAVVAVVVIGRVLWQFVVPPPLYALRRRLGRSIEPTPRRERLLLGWTGMRGAISLAAALALPLQADGEPFPGRNVLLFLTVVVVVATLVVQGTSLPYVLRRLGLARADEQDESERLARLAMADVALALLDEREATGEVPPGGATALRQVWEQARTRLSEDEDLDDDEVDLVELRLDLARAQTDELARRLRTGEVSVEVARELQRDIDLQQVRLERGR